MEHHFEKRLPTLLNYILICQDFASPSILRLYLESKGCTVVQQDDTIVGVGATVPFPSRGEYDSKEHPAAAFAVRREVEIHAYLRTPINWKMDCSSTTHRTNSGRQGLSTFTEGPTEDREDHLCLAFAKATHMGDDPSPVSYHFFEEAIAHVRSAYARHERQASAYVETSTARDEIKPVKESIYLTAREHEILKWVSEGKGCWETGAILGISERTVKFHLQNIYRKLNVVNRAQAITKAMRYSLI